MTVEYVPEALTLVYKVVVTVEYVVKLYQRVMD
jgi:hypothetical protein